MENKKSDFQRWIEAEMSYERGRTIIESLTDEQKEKMKIYMRNLLSFGKNNEYTLYLD